MQGVVFFLGYFTTPSPPFLRGILYAIHRITRLSACGDAQAGLNKIKILYD